MKTIELLKVMLPSLTGVAAFAYYVSHLMDHGANKLGKDEIAKMVRRKTFLPASRSAFNFFALASDKFFGKNLFSWRGFGKSIALSLMWIAFVLGICFFTIPNYKNWLGSDLSRNLILRSAIPLISASLIIDFLSLCLTRYLVRTSLPKKGVHPHFIVFLDLFFSMLLFYIGFSIAKILILPGHSALGPVEAFKIWFDPSVLPSEFKTLQPLTADMLVPRGAGVFDIKGGLLTELVYGFPESILFLSSLLTSIWLWLYVLGYALLFSAVRLDKMFVWVKNRLDIDHNPATAVATAIVAASILLAIVVVFFNFTWEIFAK
jgi:hypothetical protein